MVYFHCYGFLLCDHFTTCLFTVLLMGSWVAASLRLYVSCWCEHSRTGILGNRGMHFCGVGVGSPSNSTLGIAQGSQGMHICSVLVDTQVIAQRSWSGSDCATSSVRVRVSILFISVTLPCWCLVVLVCFFLNEIELRCSYVRLLVGYTLL